MTRALAAAAVLAALVGGLARAEDANPPAAAPPAKGGRIALERLRASGVSPAIVEAVEERVCATLAELPGAQVVCPSDIAAAAALARSAALFGECQSDECLERVDRMKAADRRVSGAVERGEKGIVLSLQLSAAEGPGARVTEGLPEDLDALVAKVPAVVKKLFP